MRVTVDSPDYSSVLIGRSAAIALLVAVEAARINRTQRGSLTLHWDGDSVRPEWRESGEHFRVHSDVEGCHVQANAEPAANPDP